jgi:Spy/CpxP family protein refolding chaperone
MKPIAVLSCMIFMLAPTPRARAAAEPAGETAGETAVDRDSAAGRLWKQRLALSGDQLPRFLAAVKTRDAALQPLSEQWRAGMRKLQSQLAANAPDAEVQESLHALARVRKAAAAREERFDAALSTLLTPTQRAKVLVWKSMGAFHSGAGLDAEAADRLEPSSGEELEPE